MPTLAIFCPVSERVAAAALANPEVADALAAPAALEAAPVLDAAGLARDEVLDKREVPYEGVLALGLGWIFEQGVPLGTDAGHGLPRLLSAAEADRALLAVRDVTWSGGDDLRAELEQVFSVAVESRHGLIAAVR
jgi:hypothetical protein